MILETLLLGARLFSSDIAQSATSYERPKSALVEEIEDFPGQRTSFAGKDSDDFYGQAIKLADIGNYRQAKMCLAEAFKYHNKKKEPDMRWKETALNILLTYAEEQKTDSPGGRTSTLEMAFNVAKGHRGRWKPAALLGTSHPDFRKRREYASIATRLNPEGAREVLSGANVSSTTY